MAKTKGKGHRKTIRIGGAVINSPRFYGKDAKQKALEWYTEKLKEKDFLEKGLLSSNVPTFMQYAATWIRARMANNPKSTWAADEQRLRDYLLPHLSEFPMDRITRNQMREVLKKVQEENELSIVTRTRIKALASKIFSDALNENPPLCAFNPCHGLKFSDKRQGAKLPPTLRDDAEVLSFLKTAGEFGPQTALICAIAVMAGLRKSEIIPLKYRHVDFVHGLIHVECHVEQASLTIKPGTKAGQDETREVYVSQDLLRLIDAYRKQAKFSGENDFIFTDETGDWIRPRRFHNIVDEVVKKYGRPITLHKLRHTYGRIFTARTGNLRVLQEILGHKSSATTEIYSKLAGSELKPFGEAMTFNAPVKLLGSPSKPTPIRHHNTKRNAKKSDT